MAPMSIQVPRRVHGTVTRHEPYGCYIDFGEASDGLVVITMIAKDDEEVTFPPVGSSIEAVLLGYTEIGHQPRLSLRAEDFIKAKSGWEQ